jgi:hypothetical protein
MMNITQKEIDERWELGFRPYEIYVSNSEPVYIFGKLHEAGEIEGWEIKHVFAKKCDLPLYPFFDIVISTVWVGDCEEVFAP